MNYLNTLYWWIQENKWIVFPTNDTKTWVSDLLNKNGDEKIKIDDIIINWEKLEIYYLKSKSKIYLLKKFNKDRAHWAIIYLKIWEKEYKIELCFKIYFENPNSSQDNKDKVKNVSWTEILDIKLIGNWKKCFFSDEIKRKITQKISSNILNNPKYNTFL